MYDAVLATNVKNIVRWAGLLVIEEFSTWWFPAFFVLKLFFCFFFQSEVSEPVLIAFSSLHEFPHLSVSKETSVMSLFAQTLKVVKSCCTFQHELFCFLYKRYVLIFDNQNLVPLEVQVSFY